MKMLCHNVKNAIIAICQNSCFYKRNNIFRLGNLLQVKLASLVLGDGFQLHLQSLGPLTRQDIFTLVGVILRHLRDGLFIRQAADDAGHIREARKLAGLLTAVAP